MIDNKNTIIDFLSDFATEVLVLNENTEDPDKIDKE